MPSNSDFLRSLSLLYRNCARETGAGLRLNLQHYLLHFAALVLLGWLARVVGGIGGMAGSILQALIVVFFLSVFFTSVLAAVEREKLSLRETLRRSPRLIGPMFTLFFVFSVTAMIFRSVLQAPEQAAIGMMFIAVCWNAVLERVSQSEESPLTSLAGAWTLIKEDTVEWLPAYAATALLTMLLFGAFGSGEQLILLLAVHPLQLFEAVIALAAGGPIPFFAGLNTLLVFLLLYPCFVFRGVLFHRLSKSNRRKRIFEAKF